MRGADRQISPRPPASRWYAHAVTATSVLGAVAFLLFYPPANELLWETSRIAFAIFFTPFILEFACIILGVIIVITLNNRRLAKDSADEWVYLHQVDPPRQNGAGIPDALKRRIEDSPLPFKPETAGVPERLAEIAGYIDLEMAEEATDSLLGVPEDEIDTAQYLIQRIRLAHLRGDEREVARLCDAARFSGATDSEIALAKKKFAG